MISVWDPDGLVRAAVTELPLSVTGAEGPSGAVAVIGAASAANAALRAGACGLVFTDPHIGAPEEIAELVAASADLPVVVIRSRLRVRPAVDGVTAGVVECSAPADELESVVRDGIGWVRQLTGGPLTVEAATRTDVGALASLTTHDGRPVTLIATPLSGVPTGGVIRVSILAIERVDIDVDEPAGRLATVVHRAGESARVATDFESIERQSLRRIADDEPPHDLADLWHDATIARRILTSA